MTDWTELLSSLNVSPAEMQQVMGLLQPSEKDKQGALNMGLLNAGLGVLAHNTNKRNPMPAIGAGGMMGVGAYQQELDRAEKDKMKSLQATQLVQGLKAKAQTQAMANDPSLPPQVRQMLKMGVPPAEIFKPHALPEGGSLASVASAYGMGASPQPQQGPEQLSGPGMGAPQAPAMNPGVIAQGPGKPIFQDIPLPNNQTQRQVSFDRGRTFQPVTPDSAPVDKFAPEKDMNLEKLQALRDSLPAGSPQRAEVQAMITKLTTHQPPARMTMVNQAETKYAQGAGEAGIKDDVTQFEAANSAAANLPKLKGVVNHLKTSDAKTGMGAEIILNVERAKKLLLDNKAAGKAVTDTEYLDAALGSDVFPMIQSLGIGARGMDTPAEREYLRKVMTGTITMNKDTLIKLTEIRANIAQRALDKWNSRVKSGQLDDFFTYSKKPKQLVTVPESGGWKDL